LPRHPSPPPSLCHNIRILLLLLPGRRRRRQR
jgi:hypothetical protein